MIRKLYPLDKNGKNFINYRQKQSSNRTTGYFVQQNTPPTAGEEGQHAVPEPTTLFEENRPIINEDQKAYK